MKFLKLIKVLIALLLSVMVQEAVTAAEPGDTIIVNTGSYKATTQLSLTPRAPIFISGNEGFTRENGVVRSSGTAEDPYIIEGWEINATNHHGIHNRTQMPTSSSRTVGF